MAINNDSEPLLQVAGQRATGISWVAAASLIVANMLGAGVLGLPLAMKRMGWVVGTLLLLGATAMSIYGGLLLGKLRGTDTSIRTYGDLAAKCAAKHGPTAQRAWRQFVQAIAYTYILGTLTIYLCTMRITIMNIFQKCAPSPRPGNTSESLWAVHSGDSISSAHAANCTYDCGSESCSEHGKADLHQTVWLLITAAIAYPFIHFRSMDEAAPVSYFGVLTIAVVNVIIIVRAFIESGHGHSPAPSTDCPFERSFLDVVNGMTQMAFAYGGHCLMLDMIGAMKSPHEFSKSVWVSQIFMLVNYGTVGMLGYHVYGDKVKAPITLNLPTDSLGSFSNGLLFVHVLVAYCINSTVLCRVVVNFFWPRLLECPGRRGAKMVRWALVATAVMVIGLFIAVLVPFFSDLMNIYSSVGIFTLSFFVPAALWVFARYGELSTAQWVSNSCVMCVSTVGCILGVYAATVQIKDDWAQCHYRIQF